MPHDDRRTPLLLGLALSLPLAAGFGALLARAARRLIADAELQREVLNYAVDGIMLVDEAGVIHAFNPAAERMFGYGASEVIGRQIRTLIPEPYHATYRLISIGTEVLGRRKDGATFPMDLTSGRVRQGSRNMYIAIARDITYRRRIEAELLQARDAAEAASRAKSALLLTMSHELRTPLNHILGYSELLHEEVAAVGQEQLAPDLEKISVAGRHLLSLIDQVLDLAAAEAGELALSPQPFDAAVFAREMAPAAEVLATRNGNSFRLEAPDHIGPLCTDPIRLRQVLMLLLDNAGKFTANGTVTLRVRGMRDAGRGMRGEGSASSRIPHPASRIVFEVADTGIGIAPEEQARIFEPFTQVDGSTTRRFSGTGLGLALARRICTLLGGDITLASQPGHGSTFSVHLPA
jgi:PAS domain S-box-containing protein